MSKREITSLKIWRASGAELVGTFLLVLILAGLSSEAWLQMRNPTNVVTFILLDSMVYALAVMSISWSVAHISGGYINPALTVGALFTRKVSVFRAIFYLLAQCAGAILATSLLYVGVDQDNLGLPQPHPLIKQHQAVGIEAFMTFIYAFLFSSSTDKHRSKHGAPINIAAAIFLCTLFSVPYTGACFNPARALGPAVIMDNWNVHWIYWLGPVLGAIPGTILYDTLFAGNASLKRTFACFTRCDFDSDMSPNDGKSRKSRYEGIEEPCEKVKLCQDEETGK